MRRAVFLDRDDTIIRNADLPEAAWGRGTPGDLLDPDHVRLLPGASRACRTLRDAGYLIVLFTSQGGVARGGGSLQDVERTNDRLRRLLSDTPESRDLFPADAVFDAAYFCPMHPLGSVERFSRETEWRKPAPGMIAAAAAELGIDLARSWAVGDKTRDIDAGVASGIPSEQCILVGVDGDAPDLATAARRILVGAGR